MRPRLGYLLLIFALPIWAVDEVRAQHWADPQPAATQQSSHYTRGFSQPTAVPVAPQLLPAQSVYGARPLEEAPVPPVRSVGRPLPFRLVSAEHDIPASVAAHASDVQRTPLKLAPRDKSAAAESTGPRDRPAATTPLGALSGVGGSLAVVLGLFLAVVWFSRRLAPAGAAPLPTEVLEMLGRATVGPRQQMQLVRLGNKLVLLHITATGAQALAEVTDPGEVERLGALCRRGKPGSASASFNELLTQIGGEPAPSGFVGETRRAATNAPVSRRR